jgi:hypothetical protein
VESPGDSTRSGEVWIDVNGTDDPGAMGMRVKIRAIIREYAHILDDWYDSALSDTSKPGVLADERAVEALARLASVAASREDPETTLRIDAG